jgi:hypothetical protein
MLVVLYTTGFALPPLHLYIQVTEHRRHCSEADLAAVVARVTQAEAEVGGGKRRGGCAEYHDCLALIHTNAGARPMQTCMWSTMVGMLRLNHYILLARVLRLSHFPLTHVPTCAPGHQGRIGPWEGDSDLPDRLMPHDVAPMDASSAIVMEKEHQVCGEHGGLASLQRQRTCKKLTQ